MIPGPVISAIFWHDALGVLLPLDILMAVVIVGGFVAGITGLRRPSAAWAAQVAQGILLAIAALLLGATMTTWFLKLVGVLVLKDLILPDRVGWLPGILTAGGWYAGHLIRRGLGERQETGPVGFRFDWLFVAVAVPIDILALWFVLGFLATTPPGG